jgi:hypothetical protein
LRIISRRGSSKTTGFANITDGLQFRLLDAELTPDVRRRFAIDFDPADVPRGRFVAAAHAWRMIRSGDRVADRFWASAFGLTASLLRDLAALTAEEMMPWDYWGVNQHRTGAPHRFITSL